MIARKQFTFYRSFFEAISTIRSQARRGELYDIICDYALNGALPDIDRLTDIQRSNLRLILPVLDAARQKAEAGQIGGSKPKANSKQTPSKGEVEIEKEIEKEIETETETETELKGEPLADGCVGFERFWDIYPKKVGKAQAREAFDHINVPLSVIEKAIAEQKSSIQWSKENGRYVPNPATWLEERRWEDELPMLAGSDVKASCSLGEAERDAIRRMLDEG